MKTSLRGILLGLVVMAPGWGVAGELLLKVPVRVFHRDQPVTGLQKADFSLNINGRERVIRELLPKSRNVRDFEGDRNFILKFNTTSYLPSFDSVFRYLLDEVLGEGDRLTIWTPVDTIQPIDLNREREEILEGLRKTLREDIISYRSIRNIDLSELESRLPSDFGSMDGNTTRTVASMLRNFKVPFQSFLSRYSIPRIQPYARLGSMLSDDDGYHLLIDFQQINMIPFIARLEKIFRELQDYISGLSPEKQVEERHNLQTIREIRNLMVFENRYPRQDIMTVFSSLNLNYHTVLFINQNYGSATRTANFSDFTSLLGELSRQTGGLSLDTADFLAAMQRICDHRDRFYQLVYAFDGKVEDKNLVIDLVSHHPAQLFYRSRFLQQEMSILARYAQQPQLKITGFFCRNLRLGFELQDYEIGGELEAGIIQVEVKLFDNQNNLAWSTQNTLKADTQRISIKGIPLPSGLRGAYKVQIIARDLLTQKQAEFSDYIQIEH